MNLSGIRVRDINKRFTTDILVCRDCELEVGWREKLMDRMCLRDNGYCRLCWSKKENRGKRKKCLTRTKI